MAFKDIDFVDIIPKNFTIINKQKEEVPFVLNNPQRKLQEVIEQGNKKIVILKARKQGFSSYVLASEMILWLFGKNESLVSVSFDKDAARKQLERARHFRRSWERLIGVDLETKYDSKNEMVYVGVDEEGNEYVNKLRIGSAASSSFGRGDDISFLHITEVAFAKSIATLLSGVGEAVIDNAPVILETTADGYNELYQFWLDCLAGKYDYFPFFSPASDLYSEEFLAKKRTGLGEKLFLQEYPSTWQEAFIASGSPYFDPTMVDLYMNSMMREKTIPFQFANQLP